MKTPSLPAPAPKPALPTHWFSSVHDRSEDFDSGEFATDSSPFTSSSAASAPRAEWGAFHAGTIGSTHLSTVNFQIAAPELFIGPVAAPAHSVVAPAAAPLHAPATLPAPLKAVLFHGALTPSISAAPVAASELTIVGFRAGLDEQVISVLPVTANSAITVNEGMLTNIKDDIRDGWDGAITFSIDVDYGTLLGDISEFLGFEWDPNVVRTSDVNIAAIIEAVELWDDLIGESIDFVLNNDEEDIIINTVDNLPPGVGGSTSSTIHSPLPNDADIFFDQTPIILGNYAWITVLHEFGHALGLKHPGHYNASDGDVTYENDREYDEDTVQYSIMSYFEPSKYNANINWTLADTPPTAPMIYDSPQTPMIYDILAIQPYYNVDTTTRLGSTTYGFNSTAGRQVFNFSVNTTPVLTIWDAGGDHDVLDVSGFTTAQRIDLSEGSYSDVGPFVQNVGIAFNTWIEDAVGGSGADRIDGNNLDNRIDGGGGNDFLSGGDGDDILRGGADDDLLAGGPGADELDGGSGYDTASYFSATVGVVVNRELSTGSNDAQGDTYISIERIVGSPHADIMLGSAGSDNFAGGAGDDLIEGRDGDDLLNGDAGADTLIGGTGNDFAAYSISLAAVNVSLLTGQGSGGDGQGDTLSGIENLQGSQFSDTLEGNNGTNWLRGLDGANTLRGLGGNDLLEGGKDDDLLEGGEGDDILRASQDTSSNDPTISGGRDTLRGGTGNDILYGDAGGDLLDGGDGDDQTYGGKDGDTIFGGTGQDLIFGGGGDDGIDAGEGSNAVSGDDGDDTISAGSGPDQLYGGAGNDTLNAGAGLNFLFGEAGDDVLLALADNDTLNGGDGDDQLDAGEGSNELNGDAGNDRLVSGGGIDTLHGGIGDDFAYSGAGNDFVFGDDGNDTLDGGIGADRVDGGNGNDFLSVGSLRGLTQDPERLDHLFGGAGFDTITADFSNQTVAMMVTAGQTQSLVFADEAEARDFENIHDFFTGSGDDVLRLDGSADDGFRNLLKTGAGNDVIFSGAGSDDVDAGDGDDFVNGGTNETVLILGSFGTVVGFTGPGETLAGGAGIDTISFAQLFKPTGNGANLGTHFGVSVNLGTNETNGAARGVTISGFENIIGTEYGDELTGSEADNVFMPLHGGGPVTVSATSGPDRIDGKGGLDTLIVDYSLDDAPAYGGISSYAGNRSYNSSFGRQTPGSAFWSSDSVFAFDVEQFHITGASKNDQLTGGIRGYDDILSGLGGNDILGGYGGADTLLGGDGNDVLTGEGSFAVGYDSPAGGRDVFDGGAGDDLVEDIGFNYSGPILGANPLFQLDGGSGFDTLSADFSNQTAAILWDSAAPTNMNFTDGAYARNFEALRYFASGPGNDVITQLGRVNNLFYLRAGDDIVNAGIGIDTIDGGPGNDLAIIDFSVGDTADLGGVGGYGNPDGGGYFRALVSDFGNRPDNIELRSIERVWITGSSKADTLIGTYGDERLFGGGGNDTLDGNRAGNSYLDGGEGDDSLFGAYPNYNGPGTGGGNDTLLGGLGNDTIFGNHGNDTLMGGDGNDVLSAGDRNGFGGYEYGVDVIDGGAGDDVVIDFFQYTYTNSVTRLKFDGGTGFDTLSADYGNQTQAIVFIGGQSNSVEFADGSYLRNFEQLGSFISGTGNDTIMLSGRGGNFINTGGGNDTVNPGLGIDSVLDLGGNNLLILDWSIGDTANAGPMRVEGSYFIRRDLTTGATIDSVLVNGVYSYRVTATSKDDVLTAYIGDDTYFGGAGNDSLSGHDGNDSLYGEVGNDTLNGENGNDLLDGGPGADTMTGGAGNDTYYVDNIADIINEGAGGGYDTVIYTIGGSFTQPANIEKIIFLQSTTLPSLNIGANGIVILGGAAPAPAPPASAVDFGVNEIARLQALAGTPSEPLPIRNTTVAHDTAVDIAIANPMFAFPDLFAPDADVTHDTWHHDAALVPFDFDVMDAMV